MKQFKNRSHAGQLLAKRLSAYAHRPDVLVLALPRGGVPVALAIASKLEVAMDVFCVHKLGLPGNEEVAMGAITSEGVCVLKPEIIAAFDIQSEWIEALAQRECREMARQEHLYRGSHAKEEVAGRCVILVDDGLATGATMQAAVRALKHHHPSRIVVALPVADANNCDELRNEVDVLICLRTPEYFSSVGKWYENFSPVTDAEVKECLTQFSHWSFPKSSRSANFSQPTR